MATLRFKDESPYKRPRPTPPPEDYLYEQHQDDLSFECDTGNDPVITFALFGVGRAGTIHLTNIVRNSRCKLLYIVDDIETNWEGIRNRFRLDHVTFLTSKQSEAVFKDKNVMAVIVASPTYTHEGIVTKALAARKAVFCEKPVAETREDTEKCYAVAKRCGKPLFTAFNRRFDPSYAALRQRVRNGEVGHVHVLNITSRDSPMPTIDYLRISGGIFHDCMVHDIDLMTWILGEYPTTVAVQATANIPQIRAINDVDTVVATLKFPSGTLGMINLSRNACYGYDMRLEAFGPKGMVRASNDQPNRVETMYGFNGPTTAPIYYSFASRFKLAYQREMDHFLDIILGKCEEIVKPKETLAVSRIASACEESSRTGQMVELVWAAGELPDLHFE